MIKQTRQPKSAQRRLTFVLPAHDPAGKVSVVGSFNDWVPGAHELRRRSNGTRSVTVTVPPGETVHFRYLAEGGLWFDDPDAHAVTTEGGLLHP